MEKILVIDDSALENKVMGDILKDQYKILKAKNGVEGLQLALKEEPLLILLDIVMPGMNGFQVLEILKEREKTMNIPVIFLTALEEESTEEKGLTMGAVDYIKKPYNPNIVRLRVENQVKMYRYRKAIENQMAMDWLTNVRNRSDFERQKQKIWNRAAEEQTTLSFFFVDVDYFKKVNDTYGHAVGDSVLSRVAEAMKRIVVEEEKCYLSRYGGEEFVVLMYGYEMEEGKRIGERVREGIQKLQIPNENSDVCPVVTVSIGGCTVVADSSRDPDVFIRNADDQLYRAKKNGRNRVEWADNDEGKF